MLENRSGTTRLFVRADVKRYEVGLLEMSS
jgi:hypothetical protein